MPRSPRSTTRTPFSTVSRVSNRKFARCSWSAEPFGSGMPLGTIAVGIAGSPPARCCSSRKRDGLTNRSTSRAVATASAIQPAAKTRVAANPPVTGQHERAGTEQVVVVRGMDNRNAGAARAAPDRRGEAIDQMRVHDVRRRVGDDGAEPPAGVAVPRIAQMPQRAAIRRLTVARETPIHVARKEADDRHAVGGLRPDTAASRARMSRRRSRDGRGPRGLRSATPRSVRRPRP